MSQPPTTPPPAAAEVRPLFRAGLLFGASNGLTWMIGLGTPLFLMAEQLHASALQVGLVSSAVYLMLPVQVFGTLALQRLGYRRQMVLGWGVRALFLLLPLGFAIAAPERPPAWMAAGLVASVFGFCFFRAFGVAAHLPWFAAMLPPEVRGRFFANDNALSSAVGVGTLLLCALLFAKLPGWRAFVAAYALALAGTALAVSSLLRLPSPPPPPAPRLRTLHQEARRLWLAPGLFRHYLGLALLGTAATSAMSAFTTYYLKATAGISGSAILTFSAAHFAGQIAGGFAIRRRIDAIPLRRLFQLAAAAVAAVELFWLAYVSGASALVHALPLAYLAFGAATGISNAAHSTLLPELSEEARRPLAMAIFTATQGALAGVAPVLWGLFLQAPGGARGLDPGRFPVFFAAGAAIQLGLVALFARLREPRAGLPARAA